MVRMDYNGRARTLRHGPRILELEPGPVDVHPDDVRVLEGLGATRVGELDELTVTELRELARSAEIEGRSTMDRAELVEALETHRREE